MGQFNDIDGRKYSDGSYWIPDLNYQLMYIGFVAGGSGVYHGRFCNPDIEISRTLDGKYIVAK
jgi:hypothetical protein